MYTSGDLEISCGQPFTVMGRVHSNGNMYVEPDSALTFQSDVTAVGNILFQRSPLDSRTPPSGTVVYEGREEAHVAPLYLPIGTNNTPAAVGAIIQPPPAGEDPNSPMGRERYYNLADMILVVSDTTSAPAETTAGGGDFAFRRRLDGGYTIARRNSTTAELVPDSFRLLFDYVPAFWRTWRELRLRLGNRFLTEWKTPRHWALDAASPFELVRVLDPVPEDRAIAEARRQLARAFPGVCAVTRSGALGGVIDVTPDAVPVISDGRCIARILSSTGFSGHGFGIGPGAGKLMADIVAGDPVAVDPAPYRFSASWTGRGGGSFQEVIPGPIASVQINEQ